MCTCAFCYVYIRTQYIYIPVCNYIYDIIGLKGLLHKLRLQVTRRISWKRKATCKKNVSGGIWGTVVADWPDQVGVEKKGLGHYSDMERFPVEFPVSQEKLGGFGHFRQQKSFEHNSGIFNGSFSQFIWVCLKVWHPSIHWLIIIFPSADVFPMKVAIWKIYCSPFSYTPAWITWAMPIWWLHRHFLLVQSPSLVFYPHMFTGESPAQGQQYRGDSQASSRCRVSKATATAKGIRESDQESDLRKILVKGTEKNSLFPW